MGLTVVFTITFAQPRIGATATIGILIAGQLVMGAVIDRFGLFGVDQIAISLAARARHRACSASARRSRSFDELRMTHRAKVWTALWARLHDLGLDVPRDRDHRRDDPAALRRLDALHRRGRADGCSSSCCAAGTLRVSRRALGSCVLIGCLLPGANAVLFFAERDVPTGLASLIIASVPLWVVVLRLAAARAAAGAGARRRRRRLRRRRGAGPAVGRRDHWRDRALPPLGGDVVGRLGPLGARDDARRPVRGDRVRDARGRARDAPARALHACTTSRRRPHSILGWIYLVTFGSIVGYTAYVWLLANAPLGTGLDLRVRQPGRGDRARRARSAASS